MFPTNPLGMRFSSESRDHTHVLIPLKGVENLANVPVDSIPKTEGIFEADSFTSTQPGLASFPKNGY